MTADVCVVPYDGQWPVRFAEERRVLERVLTPWVATPVQHIGSTSIPGISAKPVLDMMATIDSRLWRERLAFRNALRADSELRDEYEALKVRLAAAHRNDSLAYTQNKRAFVARVLAAAGIELAPAR